MAAVLITHKSGRAGAAKEKVEKVVIEVCREVEKGSVGVEDVMRVGEVVGKVEEEVAKEFMPLWTEVTFWKEVRKGAGS